MSANAPSQRRRTTCISYRLGLFEVDTGNNNLIRQAAERSHRSPGKQYACNPDARSDFVRQQIARDLKEEVAEKENPEEQSVLLAGDGQLFVHRQRRKRNVGAVEKGNDEKQEDKRKNPDPHFPNRLCLHRA